MKDKTEATHTPAKKDSPCRDWNKYLCSPQIPLKEFERRKEESEPLTSELCELELCGKESSFIAIMLKQNINPISQKLFHVDLFCHLYLYVQSESEVCQQCNLL